MKFNDEIHELAKNDSETKFQPIFPSISENQIHPLICERCGGTIDRELMICPYCDTEYGNRKNQR